jgi:hypothetical protein
VTPRRSSSTFLCVANSQHEFFTWASVATSNLSVSYNSNLKLYFQSVLPLCSIVAIETNSVLIGRRLSGIA